MKNSLIALIGSLIVVNFFAFVFLYFVYFPWMTSVDTEKVKGDVLADVRELNFRLSMLDYTYSPQTIARAEWELETEITTSKMPELSLSEELKEELVENRYLVFMEDEEGPLGYIILKDDKTIITLGPYDYDYDDILLKDYLFYIILLLLLNGLIIQLYSNFLERKLRPAAFALDKIGLDNYIPEKSKSHLHYVSQNTPMLVEHVQKITKQYKLSIHSQRDLMHAVAHEFRGPMARLSFAMDLLDESASKERKVELRQDMQDSLDELDSLVTEVLGYSRLKDGQHPLQLSTFNIADIAQDVKAKVQNIYSDKTFNIHMQPAEGIEMHADESLIERALINLVRNAARFSMKKVYIYLNKVHKNLEVRIEDDGPGIPPGKRERIFEPFTRLDFSRNRDSGGAGLGLAIVQSICKRHDGGVWAGDSKSLGGASFTLNIPLNIETEGEK